MIIVITAIIYCLLLGAILGGCEAKSSGPNEALLSPNGSRGDGSRNSVSLSGSGSRNYISRFGSASRNYVSGFGSASRNYKSGFDNGSRNYVNGSGSGSRNSAIRLGSGQLRSSFGTSSSRMAVTCDPRLRLFHLEDVSPATNNESLEFALDRVSRLSEAIGNYTNSFGKFGFGSYCDVDLPPFGTIDHCYKRKRPLDFVVANPSDEDIEALKFGYEASCGDAPNSQLTALFHVTRSAFGKVFPLRSRAVMDGTSSDATGCSSDATDGTSSDATDGTSSDATDGTSSDLSISGRYYGGMDVITIVARSTFHGSGDLASVYPQKDPENRFIWQPNPHDGSLQCSLRPIYDYPQVREVGESLAAGDIRVIIVAPPSVTREYQQLTTDLAKLGARVKFRRSSDEAAISDGLHLIMSALESFSMCDGWMSGDGGIGDMPATGSTGVNYSLLLAALVTLAVLATVTCCCASHYARIVKRRRAAEDGPEYDY